MDIGLFGIDWSQGQPTVLEVMVLSGRQRDAVGCSHGGPSVKVCVNADLTVINK